MKMLFLTFAARRLALPIVLAALCQGWANASESEIPNPGQIKAALMIQAYEWDKAILRKDRRAIENNMSDDFRQIDGQGNVKTKSSFVEESVSADWEIEPQRGVDDFDIRLYGDVAVLSGRRYATGRHRGKPFSQEYRYTDIYVRQNGEWKVVSGQISLISIP